MSMQRAVGKESKLRFHFNHALGSALSPPEMVGPRGTPRCLLHFSRNPFEMVVSGYMYHMAKSETWLERSFDNASSVLAATFPHGCQARDSFRCLAWRGLVQ